MALEKSQKLDAFLAQAIRELKPKTMNKFTEIAERSALIRKSLDKRADELSLRLDAIPAMADAAFKPHEALADETEAGIKSLEDSLRDLAGHNRPPVSTG